MQLSTERQMISKRLQILRVRIRKAEFKDLKNGRSYIESLYKSAPIRAFVKRIYDRIQNKNIPKFYRLYKDWDERILIPALNRAIRKELLQKSSKIPIAKSPGAAAEKVTARIFGTLNLEKIQLEGTNILKPGYTAAFIDGANASYRLAGVQAQFDVMRPEAVDQINKYGADLVVQVTDEVRKAIKDVVRFGIENGYSMPRIARDLSMVQTLFPRWAAAVVNYNINMQLKGVPADIANARARRYEQELLRKRRYMIARTETGIAQAQGSLVGYKSLGVEKVRFFAAHGACPICADQDGRIYLIEEAFGVIPVHPNGRCDWISIAPKGGYKNPAIYKPPGGLKGAIDQAIANIMRQYSLKKVEHCAVLDDAGNILLTKSGMRDKIPFYRAEMLKMQDAAALIHNHPFASSFSSADLQMGVNVRAKQLIVCSDKYRYTLTPAEGASWDPQAPLYAQQQWRSLKWKYEKKFWEIFNEEKAKIPDITLTQRNKLLKQVTDQMNQERSHEMITNTAEKFNYNYTRTPVTGG